MKLQTAVKYGKIEVLQNYWDKIVGSIMIFASKYNDKEGK
jgi:hypothetical protein